MLLHVRGTGRGRETGSVSLEIAILAPVLLLLVFAIVQAGMYWFARTLAHGAAAEGLAAGRVLGAGEGEARARSTDFLRDHSGDSLSGTSVTVSGSVSKLVVHVEGRALSVLPGVPGLPVRAEAQGPRERPIAP